MFVPPGAGVPNQGPVLAGVTLRWTRGTKVAPVATFVRHVHLGAGPRAWTVNVLGAHQLTQPRVPSPTEPRHAPPRTLRAERPLPTQSAHRGPAEPARRGGPGSAGARVTKVVPCRTFVTRAGVPGLRPYPSMPGPRGAVPQTPERDAPFPPKTTHAVPRRRRRQTSFLGPYRGSRWTFPTTWRVAASPTPVQYS